MPENAGGDDEGPRAAGSPRGLIFVAILAVTIGLAVAVSTLGGTSTQPPPRTTTEASTRPDLTTTPQDRRENVLPTFGGLALIGHHGNAFLTRSDSGAVNGAWTVVVRRSDGSLGQRGAVVTYPADTSDFTENRAPVRVGTVTGIAGRGFILWPWARATPAFAVTCRPPICCASRSSQQSRLAGRMSDRRGGSG